MISKSFAEEMLQCMRRSGVVPTTEVAALAIPIPGTDQVTTDQLARLWREAALAMNDEFLGMSQRPMPCGSFTLLCHCVLHAGTLKRALPRALDFLRIVLGNLSAAMTVQDGLVCIRLTDSGEQGRAFAHRMYWILVHGLSCWLVGRRIPLRQVDFGCDVPANEAGYRLFFGAPVRFDQAASALLFDEQFLDLPIRRSEGALRQFLRSAPSNILIRYRQDSDLAARIGSRLRKEPAAEWPGFDTVARQMRFSPASMRRRLAAEGQTFQQIKDEIRRRLAIEWLTNDASSVGEISIRLGFNEPSAFHRAFRKWTGQSPGAFRKNALGETPHGRMPP
jgi:AraC-like DNA-binding protein